MATLKDLGERPGGKTLADMGSMESLRAAFPNLSDEEIMRLMAQRMPMPASIGAMERMMRARGM